jgi:ABC-type nitrate/sulfonate/bicarbonate transport system substrate-binding protein
MVENRGWHELVPWARSMERWVAATALVLTAVTACGGSTAPATQAPKESLVIALGAVEPAATSAIYLAQITGRFAAAGLDVTIEQVAGQLLTVVVGAQADIGIIGLATALSPVKDGKETSIIYANSSGAVGGFMVAGPKIQKVTDCKKVVTFTPGSSAYAWTVRYKSVYGANYDIINVNDVNATPATVVAGNADCGVGSIAAFGPFITAGKLHLIVDPRDSSFPQDLKAQPEGVVFGLKANLQSKQSAITKFMTAYQKTILEVIRKDTPDQLATLLRQNADWQPFSQVSLSSLMQAAQTQMAPDNGYLPASVWPQELAFWIAGGSTYIQPSDPKWSYAQRVDMSYYVKANGKPTTQ